MTLCQWQHFQFMTLFQWQQVITLSVTTCSDTMSVTACSDMVSVTADCDIVSDSSLWNCQIPQVMILSVTAHCDTVSVTAHCDTVSDNTLWHCVSDSIIWQCNWWSDMHCIRIWYDFWWYISVNALMQFLTDKQQFKQNYNKGSVHMSNDNLHAVSDSVSW